MSHDLLRDRMAFVGDTPWHGLGERVPPDVRSGEMCEAAGLDWNVAKVPAPGARIVDSRRQLYDRYLIIRDRIEDEQEPVALGMVGSSYEALQNIDAFRFFEPLIDSGFARFHTAGALGNGERVWVLAKLDQQIVVRPDDRIDRYLLLSNSHDGSGAVSVRFTPIRVVCQNTLNLAVKGTKPAHSIRHTRHMQRYLEAAQAEEIRTLSERVFADAAKLFAAMATRRLDGTERYELLQKLFPRPDSTKGPKRRRPLPERWRRIDTILQQEDVTPPETAGTVWGLYNAITRDEDYRRTRELGADARLARVWFGSGQDLKIRTLDFFRNYLEAA